MEFITNSILGGIIYDLVKKGVLLTKDNLSEPLKKWAAESIAPALAEAMQDIEITPLMSEKAIELELEKSEDIAILLAKVKNPSQIIGTNQNHSGSGHNFNHAGSGHIILGDYNEKK